MCTPTFYISSMSYITEPAAWHLPYYFMRLPSLYKHMTSPTITLSAPSVPIPGSIGGVFLNNKCQPIHITSTVPLSTISTLDVSIYPTSVYQSFLSMSTSLPTPHEWLPAWHPWALSKRQNQRYGGEVLSLTPSNVTAFNTAICITATSHIFRKWPILDVQLLKR